jgi:endonuclease/exonuclease/phosphatase family metal-dependent hydrolase
MAIGRSEGPLTYRCGLLAAAIFIAWGCHTGRNYPSSTGPRYAGEPRTRTDLPNPTSLRVVAFNIEFALHVARAIALLKTDPALRMADVILLQEMDEKATRQVATALNLWYVYYPALFHLRTHRLFGNAVLSRWPIVEDQKIVLPHVSRFVRTQRTATAAAIQVGSHVLRVYSTHLGTMSDVSPSARRDQLRAILADATTYPQVVVGGDMNDEGVGQTARELGYDWPTQHGPATTKLGRLDHIFVRGFDRSGERSGTVLDARGSSDHLPVWVIVELRSIPGAAEQSP